MGHATVTLSIAGLKLDTKGITRAMGTPPSSSREPRDPKWKSTLGANAWNYGEWSLCREDVAIDDIPATVQEFCTILKIGQGDVASLGGEQTCLSLGLFNLRGTGDMFHLEHELLHELAALKLFISIDAYGGTDP